MDQVGDGKVSFIDFSRGVRGVGFVGSIKTVFQELDVDDSGIITFNEIDDFWLEWVILHRILGF